jgi:hypothetical protein
LGCRAGEDTLLVSTDSCFHRPAWIPEVVVKSAKFHTCSQTTASMRSKPDVHAQVFDPVFLAPGLRHDRVQAGIGVGADGVADDVDSASSCGMAGAPTSFVNGRRQYAPIRHRHSPRRSRRQRLSRISTCRIVPLRSTTIRLTPRFCLLGALSGRSAGRPSCGRPDFSLLSGRERHSKRTAFQIWVPPDLDRSDGPRGPWQ